jgi:hypothetical protein
MLTFLLINDFRIRVQIFLNKIFLTKSNMAVTHKKYVPAYPWKREPPDSERTCAVSGVGPCSDEKFAYKDWNLVACSAHIQISYSFITKKRIGLVILVTFLLFVVIHPDPFFYLIDFLIEWDTHMGRHFSALGAIANPLINWIKYFHRLAILMILLLFGVINPDPFFYSIDFLIACTTHMGRHFSALSPLTDPLINWIKYFPRCSFIVFGCFLCWLYLTLFEWLSQPEN